MATKQVGGRAGAAVEGAIPTMPKGIVGLLGVVLVITSATAALAQTPKMYWAEAYGNRIARSNLDGSNVETIVSGITPLRLTVDQPNGKIWWTDIAVAGNAKIRRANLDGSNVEDVVALGNVTPSAVRLSGGKLYWSEYLPVNRVLRCDLDGSNVEEILTGLAANVYGVATAPGLGKIYWTSALGDTVNRANLDGTGQETLVTGTDGANGIVVSVPLGKIYWTATGGTVNRANLDGTNVETLESGIGNLEDLDLDLLNGHVYWANSTPPGRIQRANLDGSGLVTLVTGLTSPFGVVVTDVTSPCGDGITQGAEQCDQGAANGTAGSCCTTQCELRTAGAICRTGNGVCDPAEACTGSSAVCPADQVATDGTACDDGLFCNGTDSCGSGTCGAHTGNPCTGECTATCVEGDDSCADPEGTPCGNTDSNLCTADRCDGAGTCTHVAEPDPACVVPTTAGKASLKIKNRPGVVASDAFKFKWSGGPAVALSDFGPAPASGAPFFELCVYDRSGLTTTQVLRAQAFASGLCGSVPCWRAIANVGWKFTSKDGIPDGLTQLLLKSGGAGKGKIQVKGKGTQLTLPNLPLQQNPSVVAQLRTSSGKCWGATFTAPGVNVDGQFSDRSD